MIKRQLPLAIVLLLPWLASSTVYGMGLRSIAAMPVGKASAILRVQLIRNDDADMETLMTNLAYGIDGKQTLMLGLPYRISPAGKDRLGDASLLYRYEIYSDYSKDGQMRLGLLAGAVVPTESDNDTRAQFGGVSIFTYKRHELDASLLWVDGPGITPKTGRYDISWQYRLAPAARPQWDLVPEWYSVVEYGGRWTEGIGTKEQATIGLQRVVERYVIEAGIVRDLEQPKHTQYIVSTRIRF